MVGGCFSIFLILVFIAIIAIDIEKLIRDPVYRSVQSNTFARFSGNDDPFYLNTQNQTVAIALQSFHSRKMIDENFRVYFWVNTYNYENMTESYAVQATKCSDIYAEQIA